MVHSRLHVSLSWARFRRLVFMNCSLCGEVCHCHPEPPPSALPQREDDAEAASAAAMELNRPDPDAWRRELSARLDRYRSRRKVRPPRYPSLRLQFDPVQIFPRAETPSPSSYEPVFETSSSHALALEPAQPAVEEHPREDKPESSPDPRLRYGPPAVNSSAKIIEFPRFAWGPPSPPPDQLAEPVSERPRILEVPDSVPPGPALGGITIESALPKEIEKRPGIDTPLQSAPLAQRLLASAIDGMIVATATSLFGYIFWKVAAVRPPLVPILGMAAGVMSLLWAGYQYLLIVYGGDTPGLRVAGLQLSRFDGSGTSRSLRRWRALASFLSAASLGLGYAWVFLDEDMLCWHDRITHSYLAPRTRGATGAPSQTS